MSITKVRYNQIAPVPEQDDTAVDLSSIQTITGRKTFSNLQVNLSPESATANHGGKIAFHYNQSSAATSSVYEYENTKIEIVGSTAITGDLLIGGTIIGSIKITGNHGSSISSPGILLTGGLQNYAIQIQNTGMTKGTAPEANVHSALEVYGSAPITSYNQRLGCLEHRLTPNNESLMMLRAYKTDAENSNGSCEIACIADANGNAYTKAPTPDTTDATTKIATTAYVKNRITEIKNVGSTYVMNIDDFNNGAGYYACGSLSTAGTGNHISSTYNGTTDIGDYRFLVEGHSAAYKCILAFSPRITDGFYYGRFWNKVWEGWHKVPTMIEGEWTPVLTGRDTKGELTYSIQSGKYCKIGHLVYIYGRVRVSGITTQPVGRVGIEGLPFTSNGTFVSINIQGYGGTNSSFTKATVGYWDGPKSMLCIHGNSATTMGVVDHLVFSTTSTTGRNIQFSSAASTNDGFGQFLFSGCYTTNS